MKKIFTLLALLIPMISLADGVVSPRTAQLIKDDTALRIKAIKEGRLRLKGALVEGGRLKLLLIMNDRNSLNSCNLDEAYEVLWENQEGTSEVLCHRTFKGGYESKVYRLSNPKLRFELLASAILADDTCLSRLTEEMAEVLRNRLAE
jgi:hypothetical protein